MNFLLGLLLQTQSLRPRERGCKRVGPLPNPLTRRHCRGMPADLITRAYSSISLRTNLANSSGDMSMVSFPRLDSRSRTPGSASALRVSAEILATIFAGVPAGAQMPNHKGASAPWIPASPVVGISGSWLLRFAVLTASARTLPPLMWGIAAGSCAQEQSTD